MFIIVRHFNPLTAKGVHIHPNYFFRTATSMYLRSGKQYLPSQLEVVVWLNLQLHRPLLRPDIGTAAEEATALQLQ